MILDESRGYVIVIEGSPPGYSAIVPDLPGCVATGPTLSEVKVLMDSAIPLAQKGMRAAGLKIPRPRSLAELRRMGIVDVRRGTA